MQNLKKLLNLVEHKNKIDIKRGESKYMNTDWLLKTIVDEVEEVREEIKPNNQPYLEDELGDILWGWITLVEKLKDKGYVTSTNRVIERCLSKYEERILPLKGNSEDRMIWREVKAKQKVMLEEEIKLINQKDKEVEKL